MRYFDIVQIAGATFIFLGYGLMGRSMKWSSAALTIGCAIWAYWCTLTTPIAWWMMLLEVTLGAMSARTFWINRRA